MSAIQPTPPQISSNNPASSYSSTRISDQIPFGARDAIGVITLLAPMAGQGTTLGYTFAQLTHIIELVEDKDRVGVSLDTRHALAAYYDFRTAKLEETVGIENLDCRHFNLRLPQ